MVLVAFIKRILLGEMPASLRADFLERLDSLTNGVLHPEMIKIITPATDEENALIEEAWKLCPPSEQRSQILDIFAKKFSYFAQLNPSYLAALRWQHAFCNGSVPVTAVADSRPAHLRVEMPAPPPWAQPSEPLAPQRSMYLEELQERRRRNDRTPGAAFNVFTGGSL
jgi:hypothetical protein